MKPGDMLKDKLTGKPMKLIKFLNDDESLLLVDFDGKGEVMLIREEVESCT